MPPEASRGIPWTLATYAGTRCVTLLTTLVLARMLAPSDFGLFAMATIGMELLSVFSGLWLGAALIVRDDLSAKGEGTVLTLLTAAGALFAVILLAVAPLAAAFFGEPRLTGIVVVLAAVLLVSGVNWFYETLLQRELAFRRRFVAQGARAIVFSVVALGLAAGGAGVWSLVLAYLASYVASAATLLALAPYRVRPAFDRSEARRVVHSGRGFLGQDLATFLGENADYLAVGRLLGPSQLGFYSMAFRQAELPHYAIAQPVSKVTFPAFAQMRHRGEDVRPSFLNALRLMALATCPIGIVLSAAAIPFTVALLGESWRPAAAPLAVLGVWAVMRPLQVTVGNLLNSLDRAQVYGRVSMISLVPLIGATFLAAGIGGTTAVAVVLLAHMAATLAILMVGAARAARLPVRVQVGALAPLALASVVSWFATRAIADATAGAPAALALVAAGAGCLISYLGVLAIVDAGLLRSALRDARQALGRPPRAPRTQRAPRKPGAWRPRLRAPALALASAAVLGAGAAVEPKLALGAVGAALLLALPFFAPVAHLLLLVAVTAIVPFSVLESLSVAGSAGGSGIGPVDLLLLGGLCRALLVLLDTPLGRRSRWTIHVVLAFMAVAVLQLVHGVLAGADTGTAGAELRVMLGFGAAVIALPLLADAITRRRLFRGMIWVGLAVGLWGIVQWTVSLPFTAAEDAGVREGVRLASAGRGQLQGGLFAFPVVVVMATAALLSSEFRHWRERSLLAAVLALNCVDLLLTYERTFWVATAVALAVLVTKAAPSQRLRALTLGPALVAAVIAGLFVVAPRDATAARQRLLSIGQYDSDLSVRFRVTENDAVRDRIHVQPLSGSGLGSTILWGRPYEGVRATTESFSHNGYLWVAWKLGVPAAVLLTALFLWAALSRRGPPLTTTTAGAMRAGAQASLILLLIANLAFPAFNSLGATAVIGLLTAIALAPRAWDDARDRARAPVGTPARRRGEAAIA